MAEVEAMMMFDLRMNRFGCPGCMYDLRATSPEQNGRIRCPECGKCWNQSALIQILTARERRLLFISTYGPGFVFPALVIAGLKLWDDATASVVVPLFMLCVYALVHSTWSTPQRDFRQLHVVLRAVIFAFMNLMLAVPSTIVWLCIIPIIRATYRLLFR